MSDEPVPWAERWQALWGVWPIVLIFVIVFGGIYGGPFSPTAGAAVGAVATFLAAFTQRELGWRAIKARFVGTAETGAMIYMIFLGADMMNVTLALTAMPAALADWVSPLQLAPLAIVAAVLVFYVLLGCVMDELSMLLLTGETYRGVFLFPARDALRVVLLPLFPVISLGLARVLFG